MKAKVELLEEIDSEVYDSKWVTFKRVHLGVWANSHDVYFRFGMIRETLVIKHIRIKVYIGSYKLYQETIELDQNITVKHMIQPRFNEGKLVAKIPSQVVESFLSVESIGKRNQLKHTFHPATGEILLLPNGPSFKSFKELEEYVKSHE